VANNRAEGAAPPLSRCPVVLLSVVRGPPLPFAAGPELVEGLLALQWSRRLVVM
jgi:hypothetical protein